MNEHIGILSKFTESFQHLIFRPSLTRYVSIFLRENENENLQIFAKLPNFWNLTNFIINFTISYFYKFHKFHKFTKLNIPQGTTDTMQNHFPPFRTHPLPKMFSAEIRSRKEFRRVSYLKRIIRGHQQDLSAVANFVAETFLPANLSEVRGARFKPAWRELIERRSPLVDCPSAPIRKFEVKLRAKKVGSDWVTRERDRGTGPKDGGNRRRRNANGLGRKAD